MTHAGVYGVAYNGCAGCRFEKLALWLLLAMGRVIARPRVSQCPFG